MFSHKALFLSLYVALLLVALGVVIRDVIFGMREGPAHLVPEAESIQQIPWRTGIAIAALAWLPLMIALLAGPL